MIEEILPPEAAAAEAFRDVPGTVLFPEEEAAIARAVAKRRNEFTTARSCARAALARLGLPPAPIVPGPRGAPQWPAGVAGSITHCAGYRAAVVAHAADIVSLGVDAEPNDVLPDGVLGHIALDEEQGRLPGLAAARPGVAWDRLLFCAKEAIYKAWFPLTGRWLGFEDAAVTFADPAAAGTGTFTGRLLQPAVTADGRPLDGFSGRWLARDGLLLTAIAVPA